MVSRRSTPPQSVCDPTRYHVTRRGFGALALGTWLTTWIASCASSEQKKGDTPLVGMQTRRLGTMKCSLTGLGLVTLGRDGDYPAAERLIHTALDSGINFFDTGQNYGDVQTGPDTGKFVSEEYLGQALVGHRSQAYIATKCGYADDRMPRTWIGLGAASVEEQCDRSLRKLRTDYIDLYQLHRSNDPKVPIEETLGAMGRLVQKGKVRFIGTSNADAGMLKEQQAAAKKAGTPRFIATQAGLSLLSRGAVTNLIPTLDQLDIGLIPTTPLANGFLTGKYKQNEPPPAGSAYDKAGPEIAARRLTEKNFEIIQALESWAMDHGHSMLELAFGWIAAQPRVASIIAGATKPEQVVQNAKATEWKLTRAQVDEVTAIAASFDERGLPPPNNS